MFKATLSEASLLKDSIDTISKLIDEGIFQVTSDSISLKASDRATVAVVDFELKEEAFESLECDEEMNLGVNLERFLKILKRAGSEDKITMKTTEDESKLVIEMSDRSERRFEMPLLSSTSGDIPETRQLEYSAELELKSSLMDRGVSDAEIVSDSLIFIAEDDTLTVEAEGDSSRVVIKTDSGSEDIIDMDVEEKTKSRYPLEYLKNMLKASRISEVMSMRFGEDYPMELIFSQPEKVEISFVLAPRVEE